jgi:hypothetical protein
MKPEELQARLRGVIAFPITPLKLDLSLDIPGLRKILQGLLDRTVFVAPKRSRPQITQRKFSNSGPCTGLIVSQLCASRGGPLAFCESLIAKSLGLAICLHGHSISG